MSRRPAILTAPLSPMMDTLLKFSRAVDVRLTEMHARHPGDDLDSNEFVAACFHQGFSEREAAQYFARWARRGYPAYRVTTGEIQF